MVFFAIMRSWGWMVRSMMTINRSRCRVIGGCWRVSVWGWGYCNCVMRYMMFYRIDYRPTTQGDDEYGYILQLQRALINLWLATIQMLKIKITSSQKGDKFCFANCSCISMFWKWNDLFLATITYIKDWCELNFNNM